jgi:phosphate transport system protein
MIDQQHIASAFDRDLENLQAVILKMGGLVENAIFEGSLSLSERDVERAEKVRAGDKVIDALELRVNEEAAKVIALRSPVSRDLRMILGVMRLAASLERIGDYAKNMAKRTPALADLGNVPGADQALLRMAREVQGMLKDLLDAFIRRDPEAAAEVIQRDGDVDQMYNSLFREFLTFMMEDPRNITACMHLHFIAKNIERMGDLVTNMAEQVIYVTTGERPEEARTKRDNTAYVTKPE